MIVHQEEEQERVRREFEAQLEAVSQLELLQKEERARCRVVVVAAVVVHGVGDVDICC